MNNIKLNLLKISSIITELEHHKRYEIKLLENKHSINFESSEIVNVEWFGMCFDIYYKKKNSRKIRIWHDDTENNDWYNSIRHRSIFYNQHSHVLVINSSEVKKFDDFLVTHEIPNWIHTPD